MTRTSLLSSGGDFLPVLLAKHPARSPSSARTPPPLPSLRERLDTRTLPPLQQRLVLLAELAQLLAYAHDQGIVHGDLRPEQVWWAEDGAVYLGGFHHADPA